MNRVSSSISVGAALLLALVWWAVTRSGSSVVPRHSSELSADGSSATELPWARSLTEADAGLGGVPDGSYATGGARRVRVASGPVSHADADAPKLVLRFVDDVTGEPISGVVFDVFSEQRQDRVFASGECDADGLARVTGLQEGTWLVRSKRTKEHAPRVSGLWYVPNGVSAHEVRLDAGEFLDVHVADDLGQPIEGAVIEEYWKGEGYPLRSKRGITDSDGRLRLDRLAPRARNVWIENGKEAPRAWSNPIVVASLDVDGDPAFSDHEQALLGEGSKQIEFMIPRLHTVRGTVRDQLGSPVVGAVLTGRGGFFGPGFERGLTGLQAETDSAGQFVLLQPSSMSEGGESAERPLARAMISALDGRRQFVMYERPAPGDAVEVEWVLEGEPGLVIRVIDAATNEPAKLAEATQALRTRDPSFVGDRQTPHSPRMYSVIGSGLRLVDSVGTQEVASRSGAGNPLRFELERAVVGQARMSLWVVGYQRFDQLVMLTGAGQTLDVRLQPKIEWPIRFELDAELESLEDWMLVASVCQLSSVCDLGPRATCCIHGVDAALPLDERRRGFSMSTTAEMEFHLHLRLLPVRAFDQGEAHRVPEMLAGLGPFHASSKETVIRLARSDFLPVEGEGENASRADREPRKRTGLGALGYVNVEGNEAELVLQIELPDPADAIESVWASAFDRFGMPAHQDEDGRWRASSSVPLRPWITINRASGQKDVVRIESWIPGAFTRVIVPRRRRVIFQLPGSGEDWPHENHGFRLHRVEGRRAGRPEEQLCEVPGMRRFFIEVSPGGYLLSWGGLGESAGFQRIDVVEGEGEQPIDVLR